MARTVPSNERPVYVTLLANTQLELDAQIEQLELKGYRSVGEMLVRDHPDWAYSQLMALEDGDASVHA